MILDWFSFFVSALDNVITFFGSFIIFGNVSLLHFSIVCLVSGMLLNVFLSRGSA